MPSCCRHGCDRASHAAHLNVYSYDTVCAGACSTAVHSFETVCVVSYPRTWRAHNPMVYTRSSCIHAQLTAACTGVHSSRMRARAGGRRLHATIASHLHSHPAIAHHGKRGGDGHAAWHAAGVPPCATPTSCVPLSGLQQNTVIRATRRGYTIHLRCAQGGHVREGVLAPVCGGRLP